MGADQSETTRSAFAFNGGPVSVDEQWRQGKKSSQAADHILAAVKSGIYRPGEKLPSEREFAKALRVSRNSVREAISALQITGVVQSRVGDGTYVLFPARGTVWQSFAQLALAGVDLVDIWRAKEEIEKALLLEAMDRATPRLLEAAERALTQMGEAADTLDCEGFTVSTVTFHLSIAQASDNTTLKLTERLLLGLTAKIYNVGDLQDRDYLSAYVSRSVHVHRRILEVVRNRDASRVTEVMAEHFAEVMGLIHFVEAQYRGNRIPEVQGSQGHPWAGGQAHGCENSGSSDGEGLARR